MKMDFKDDLKQASQNYIDCQSYLDIIDNPFDEEIEIYRNKVALHKQRIKDILFYMWEDGNITLDSIKD
jgi:hypothetical protein